MKQGAESTFKAIYHRGETNFMTPDVVRYGWIKSWCYELSVGDSIFRDGGQLWGITIVDSVRKVKLYDESECFETKSAAEKCIARLKGNI